jgi:hypothetical protein
MAMIMQTALEEIEAKRSAFLVSICEQAIKWCLLGLYNLPCTLQQLQKSTPI